MSTSERSEAPFPRCEGKLLFLVISSGAKLPFLVINLEQSEAESRDLIARDRDLSTTFAAFAPLKMTKSCALLNQPQLIHTSNAIIREDHFALFLRGA